MRRLRSLKVVAVSALALIILAAGEVSQAVAEGFLIAEENQMTELVNRHRAEHGLPEFSQNGALQMVARRQASRMVAAGYIYHNPDLAKEAEEAVPRWLRVGENVGVGPGVPQVQNAFLSSSAHHANIDHPEYNVIGLGAAPSSNGALYFTQNFARTSGGTDSGAPGAGGGTTASAPANAGVVTTCRVRRGRQVCSTTRQRPARRPARRRATRVRGVEIVRPEQRDTPQVTFVGTVKGTLGRAGDRIVWWDD